MGVSVVVIVILAVVVLWIIAQNIRIVAQAHCFVIERLGQYQTTWKAGLHVKMPFIDKVVSKISLKEQVLDFPPQSVITKDNVTMQIDSVVYAKVFDPKLYTYGVENPMIGLQNLAATTLRNIIGAMELDATLSSRDVINAEMQQILDEATDQWGIKVTRVEIKNIVPPAEIEEVMTKQMRAERERRQTVLEAQAHQEAVVSRAEGDKKAKILSAEAERDAQIALAEGQAEAIRKVYLAEADGIRALAGSGVSEAVLRLKALDALKDVADGQATKIYIPNDLSKSLASLSVMGDALGISKEVPKAGIPKNAVNHIREQYAVKNALEADPCLEKPVSKETVRTATKVAQQSYQNAQVTIPPKSYEKGKTLPSRKD